MAALVRGAMPLLYAILDGEAVQAAGRDLIEVARALRESGVGLLQYRDKHASEQTILANARRVREVFLESAILILNDAPMLCVQAGWDGVHVGQGDITAAEARKIVGADRIVGVSTHGASQVVDADASVADYIAIGPVFATRSKSDTEAEVGLAGVAEARALTNKPLIAIGGIDAGQVRAVLSAGADAVAVIGALLRAGSSVEENVRRLTDAARQGC